MGRPDSSRDVVPGFGAALKARRETAGLSLLQLAERCGVHFTSLSKLERGQRAPSLRLASEVARALGVSLDVLLLDAARLAPSEKVSENPPGPA